MSDLRCLLPSAPRRVCKLDKYFILKPRNFYWNDAAGQESSPALADVGAGDGIPCVKVPPIVNFDNLDASGVVVERFRSLRGE